MVADLREGRVFGSDGWVGLDASHVLEDWNTYEQSNEEIVRSCARAQDAGVVELSGTTASLRQLGWGNYYHWLLQGLPRLIALRHTVEPGEIDHLLVGTSVPFVTECLERLGFDPAQFRSEQAGAGVSVCERLIAGNMPLETPTPRWALDAIRALFPRSASTRRSSRIYLTRANAQRRRVVNETDVVDALGRHGFTCVSLDGLSVAAQAQVVREAETIVAPHGAAMANLAFADPGVNVIEFVPANNPQPLFWHLAEQVGAHYRMLVGVEPALPREHRIWMNDADLVVDVGALDRLLASTH